MDSNNYIINILPFVKAAQSITGLIVTEEHNVYTQIKTVDIQYNRYHILLMTYDIHNDKIIWICGTCYDTLVRNDFKILMSINDFISLLKNEMVRVNQIIQSDKEQNIKYMFE